MGGKERSRYLTPIIVGVVAFVFYMGLEWWATARVYTGLTPEGSRMRASFIASILTRHAFMFASQSFVAIALVVAGRRRSFYLPQILVGVGELLFLMAYFMLGNRSFSFPISLTPLVFFLPLAPAIALLRVSPSRREPPRLDRGAWYYLAVLFIAVMLIQELLSPFLFDSGQILLGIVNVLSTALFTGSLFVFGAGLGTRRPLWPWALAIPSITRILGWWMSDLIHAGHDGFGSGSFAYFFRWEVVLPPLITVYAAATWEPFLRFIRGWRNRSLAPGEQVQDGSKGRGPTDPPHPLSVSPP